jgi:hypothetical protein
MWFLITVSIVSTLSHPSSWLFTEMLYYRRSVLLRLQLQSLRKMS